MKARAKLLLMVAFHISMYSYASAHLTPIEACYTHWYPYSYEQDGKAAGISIEIYKAIIDRAELNVAFTPRPWARCVREFKSGHVNAIVDGGIRLPKSLNGKNRPIPWIIVFWVRNESPHKEYTQLSQFDNHIVAQSIAYGYPQSFLSFSGFKERRTLNDDLLGLQLLNAQRADLFIGDLFGVRLMKVQHDFNIRPLLPPIEVRYLTLSFSDQMPFEFQRFESALESMIRDGSLDLFYLHHFGMTYHHFIQQFGPEKPLLN
ncbi:substrate-binding periplasmic protein [Hahella ganghwensis]|uniref:substrate-binding periplasmic protein n=1 Tax=Hahella ganghwensis TaxID=286420 RepID=UPI0003803A0C|nr:transporter substrate-binding domain-containing protein [Hahella ganghwensis]